MSTALKAGLLDKKTVTKLTNCMARLNNKASELMQEVGIHACTDITGFGFLGHTVQLAQNSRVGINIDVSAIPFFPEAGEFARQGRCPGGLFRNREFYSPNTKIASEVPQYLQDILFDPQTSGGLLISVAPRKAKLLLDRLHQAGVEDAVIVGEVVTEPAGVVAVN